MYIPSQIIPKKVDHFNHVFLVDIISRLDGELGLADPLAGQVAQLGLDIPYQERLADKRVLQARAHQAAQSDYHCGAKRRSLLRRVLQDQTGRESTAAATQQSRRLTVDSSDVAAALA